MLNKFLNTCFIVWAYFQINLNINISGKSRSLLHSPDEAHDLDTDPYGLTIKPGPPWEVPPKTPAIPIPPNVVVETIDDDVISKHVDNTDSVRAVNLSTDNVTAQSAPDKVEADSQDYSDTPDHRHRQDLWNKCQRRTRYWLQTSVNVIVV